MTYILVGIAIGILSVVGVTAALVASYKKGYRDAEQTFIVTLKEALKVAAKVDEDLTDTDKKNWN